MFTLAVSPFVVGLLVVLFVIVSIMLLLIVLIQRPQGGGLSEAFGASSGSNTTAFGAKTGDALTTATIVIFVLFLGFAIGLNYMVRPPREIPGQTPEVASTSPETGAVTAQPIDPETGEPGAPVQLQRLPGPPPGFSEPTPIGGDATDGSTSTFTAPPEPSEGQTAPLPPPAEPEPQEQPE